MRVDISRILDPSRGIVLFSSGSGSASARWMGAGPAQLGSFDVEIEVPEEVVEWRTATSADTAISGSFESDSNVRIDCEVMSFDAGDDSVVQVRLGSDVLLVEVVSRRSDLSVGDLISFTVPEVQLYPYDL